MPALICNFKEPANLLPTNQLRTTHCFGETAGFEPTVTLCELGLPLLIILLKLKYIAL